MATRTTWSPGPASWENDLTQLPASQWNYDRAAHLLVTLGGGDVHNVTADVLQALGRLDAPIDVRVVVGGTNPHAATLAAEAECPTLPIELLPDVSDMAELFFWADLAVTAGGGTCWEMAFCGLPALIIVTADNQRQVARALDDAGAAVSLGERTDWDERRAADAIASLITNSTPAGFSASAS